MTRLGDHLPTPARILTIDIETMPHETYQWDPRDEYTPAIRMKKRGRLGCFAAKWYGHREMIFHATWQYGGEVRPVVQAAVDLLTEADIVVTYNGNKFDIPRLKGERVREHIRPWTPFRSVDLYPVARGLGWPYKSLDEVCHELGVPGKMKTGGFELWLAVMAGDPRAQAKMQRYNETDVRRTEVVYTHFRPDLNGQANLALWAPDGKLACPNCGSRRLAPEADVRTVQTTYGAYRCRKCGTPVRANFIKHRVSTRVAR